MVGHYLENFAHQGKALPTAMWCPFNQIKQSYLTKVRKWQKYNFKRFGHTAIARALNLPVSTKQCVEICRSLRFKDISYAKEFVEEVSLLKRAVPYKRSVMNIARKVECQQADIHRKPKRDIAPAKISRSQRTGERIGRL